MAESESQEFSRQQEVISMDQQHENFLNQIHCGEAVELLKQLADNSIDLTLTSPPYDQMTDTFDLIPTLRDYNGYSLNFADLADGLWRVTTIGGVVVWVVGDATINGSETGVSFRQALYFKRLGFNLHDTMIYQTDKQPLNGNRYEPKFEYMFVLSKGSPKTFNPITEPSKYAGSKNAPKELHKNGTKKEQWGDGIIKKTKVKGNIWYIPSGKGKSTLDKVDHPAIFPEALARDHIISWTNSGDTVLDPLTGSGTTCKMAKETGRQWLGFEISAAYCDIARRRVEAARVPLFIDEAEIKAAEPKQLPLIRNSVTGINHG